MSTPASYRHVSDLSFFTIVRLPLPFSGRGPPYCPFMIGELLFLSLIMASMTFTTLVLVLNTGNHILHRCLNV